MTFLNYKAYDRVIWLKVSALVFVWLFGLVIGIFLVQVIPGSIGDSVMAATAATPSWLALFLTASIPFTIGLIAIREGWFLLLCLLLTFWGICRGTCGFLIFASFGSGAWIIRLALMFSSIISSFLLWWLILRHYFIETRLSKRVVLSAAFLLTLFTVVDRLLITPYLINLSMYL